MPASVRCEFTHYFSSVSLKEEEEEEEEEEEKEEEEEEKKNIPRDILISM